MTFRVCTQQQPTSGNLNGTVYVLEGDGDRATVWPALGFNCYQWQVKRGARLFDLLYADPQLFGSGRPTRSGIPVLFPFPNRLRDGRFTRAEKDYQLPLNDSSRKHAIHGFVCRRPWRVSGQGADERGAWITGEFRASADDPESHRLWPADYVLRLTYRLSPGRLRLEAEVTNPDRVSLPFGLGYHPYFSVPPVPNGGGEECLVQVPARSYWVLEDSLPTGEKRPVDEARDLMTPRKFATVTVDDVLTDIDPGGVAAPEGLRWNGTLRQNDMELRLYSSPSFRELVVFTPPHRQAFCIEPYTCPTDAIHLRQRGLDVGWQVLEPDQKWTSTVELVVT